MRVRVLASACDGFGLCANHCPQVFQLDEWGYAYAAAAGVVPQGTEHLARRAVIDCPVHAIEVVDE